MRANTRTARRSAVRKGGRRHPLAAVALIAHRPAASPAAPTPRSTRPRRPPTPGRTAASQRIVDQGKKLFQANCATCHGLDAQGTSVGARPDRRRRRGRRLPGRHRPHADADAGPQAQEKPVQFTDDADQAARRLRRLARARPGHPRAEVPRRQGRRRAAAPSCSASTAPCATTSPAPAARSPRASTPRRSHGVSAAAHLRGHGHRPAEHAGVQRPEHHARRTRRDIITYLKYIQKNPSPGGFELGTLGPVAEGLFLWIFGLGAIVALTVWITAKSN